MDVLFSVIWFLVGLVTGFLLRGIVAKIPSLKEGALIGIIVSTIWAISVMAEILKTGYSTPFFVHTLMGAVVGVYFKGGFAKVGEMFKK